MAIYRRLKSSDRWHWCRNCTNWPTKKFAQRRLALRARDRLAVQLETRLVRAIPGDRGGSEFVEWGHVASHGIVGRALLRVISPCHALTSVI